MSKSHWFCSDAHDYELIGNHVYNSDVFSYGESISNVFIVMTLFLWDYFLTDSLKKA